MGLHNTRLGLLFDGAQTGHRDGRPTDAADPDKSMATFSHRQQRRLRTTAQLAAMAAPLRRKALPITDAELKLMASAAIIGESIQPVSG